MPPLSKKRYLKICRDRIDAARKFRQKEAYDDLWCRMNDLYRGKHWPKEWSQEDTMVVNISKATIDVIGPAVAVNYPKITVTPRSAQDADSAEMVEAIVNYWWKHYDVLPEFQAAVKDFLIYGFGYVKTGYRFVEEDEPLPESVYQEQFRQERDKADEFAAANPDLAQGMPTDEDILASIPTTRKVIAHDAPFVERVSVHDLFWDPEATSPRDARWVAQRVTKTYSELVHNEQYKKAAVRKAEVDSGLDETTFRPEKGGRDGRKDFDRYTVWEYYDLVDGSMCVFADAGGEDFLVEPVAQPYAFGHPFVMLRNYDVPDQFYPMGELEALEPVQQELNAVRTAMFNDRKQFQQAYLYNPARFDQAGLAELRSDRPLRAIPVNGQGPLLDAITTMPSANPNPQLYTDSEVIMADATQVTGINEYLKGSMPEIRRTATEAAIIQDAANARAADKLAKVEKTIGEIGSRMVQLAQQYMHEGQEVSVIGGNGLPHHFHFEPEDIEGEYHFDVEGGSTQPLNEQQRRQNALDLLQMLAPYGDPALGLVNMREVLAHALKDGFGMNDPGRFLGPDPAQMQLGMPEEEMMGGPLPPGEDDEGPIPPDVMAAVAAQQAGAPAPAPAPLGGPPGGYGAAAAAESGGGIPPEIAAQLAQQMGLSL